MFACAVIKKRRYWPSMMEDHFGKLEVGETDAIQGIVYGDIYNLWGTKDPIYVMSMMAIRARRL